ncbi:hypothetical protein AYI70_g508 [Smittium culicis]|uniref:Uncharacterized protein n=1 Tax=Smittium culicis TaxID=133412 RepID=A0A1R1YGH5_9FUNG|nr:hypothetical protein AYI70_g508 [Smittium culicis]
MTLVIIDSIPEGTSAENYLKLDNVLIQSEPKCSDIPRVEGTLIIASRYLIFFDEKAKKGVMINYESIIIHAKSKKIRVDSQDDETSAKDKDVDAKQVFRELGDCVYCHLDFFIGDDLEGEKKQHKDLDDEELEFASDSDSEDTHSTEIFIYPSSVEEDSNEEEFKGFDGFDGYEEYEEPNKRSRHSESESEQKDADTAVVPLSTLDQNENALYYSKDDFDKLTPEGKVFALQILIQIIYNN